MIEIKRTTSDDDDFRLLVSFLDEELAALDGDEHVFYAQLNKTDNIPTVIVAYENAKPVGIGATREISTDTTEIKRMYVPVTNRNKGIGLLVLSELEKWAAELGYKRCVLETGKRQPDAIALYTKAGYKSIANYGNYKDVENSVCFEKVL